MEIFKIIAVALTGVILAAVVRNFKTELSIYIVLATVITVFLFSLEKLTAVFGFLEELYGQISYGKTFFPIIIKVLAVAYLTDFTAQICRDAGQGAIGSKVELAGKVLIFYLAIPILVTILDLIDSIL